MLLTKEYTDTISKKDSFMILLFMEDFHKTLSTHEVPVLDSMFVLDVVKGVWFIPGKDTEEDLKNGTHTAYYTHSEMLQKMNELKIGHGKTLLRECRWEDDGELTSVEKYTFEHTTNTYIKNYFDDLKKIEKQMENQEKINKFIEDKVKTGGSTFV